MRANPWTVKLERTIAAEKELQAKLRRRFGAQTSGDTLHLRIEGQVNGELAENIVTKVRDNQVPRHMRVLLDTLGGDVECAFHIIAAITAHRAIGRKIFVREASSAGFIILQALAGTKIIAPDGVVAAHRTRGSQHVRRTLEAFKTAQVRRSMSPELYALVMQAGDDGRTLSAGESLALGIVHRVEDFSFPGDADLLARRDAVLDRLDARQAQIRGSAVFMRDGAPWLHLDKRIVRGLAASIEDGAPFEPVGLPSCYIEAARELARSGHELLEWPL